MTNPTRDEIEAAKSKLERAVMLIETAWMDVEPIPCEFEGVRVLKSELLPFLEALTQAEPEQGDMIQSYDIDKEPEKFGFVKGWNARGNSLQEAQPAPTGWRTIDSAPRDGQPFIAFGPKGIFETWWDCVDGGGHPENGPELYWWVSDDTEYCDGPYDAPTHWMPLPPEPDKSE